MSEVNIIPRNVLFGNPVKTSPQISPNGKMMSYIAPLNNVLNIWVGDINSEDYKVVTKDTNRGILNYFWAQDNQHILYLQDKDGNENWRLYAVDLKSGEIKDFTPFEEVQVQVLAHNKHFPDDILIAMNKDNPHVHDIYHLNLKNSQINKVAENPGNIASWEVDTNLKVRGAMVATEEGGFELMVRDTEESEWKNIISWEMEDSLNSGAVLFSKDGEYIYVRDSKDFNTGRLKKINLKTGESSVIIEDPEYDVSDIMIHPDTYEIQMVSFTKAKNEHTIFDESIRDDVDKISKLNPGDFMIYDRDDSDKTWLIGYTNDNTPVAFYAYDRETKQGKFLFYSKPDLANYQLASMKPISFTSRDGLTIHGYLTMPVGKEEQVAPMVLNVHGGPWHRDTWGYNPEAQWLANRGYACLQVNFRGSTGYGKSFLNAGDREWGGKMHDDLIDAVEWAIKNGYTERDKVAIYGGSYGGYAALVGATFTPDTFTCAIDVVGPSSIITLINTIPAYWSTFLNNFKKRVGDPETEEEFLKSRSPLFKVDNIKIPMLIAQGANDPRVKQSEAEQIVDAMKSKGIDHEYLLFPDEGHGFVKPENRIKFYSHAEKFLAKHLGGRHEE